MSAPLKPLIEVLDAAPSNSSGIILELIEQYRQLNFRADSRVLAGKSANRQLLATALISNSNVWQALMTREDFDAMIAILDRANTNLVALGATNPKLKVLGANYLAAH